MSEIFVVGSLNMDLIFSTKRLPKVGETMQSDNFNMLPGGKGANQAVACALLDVSSYMIGNIGDDLFGEMIRKSLKIKGVNTDYLSICKGSNTGVACIVLNNKDNRIILDQGANQVTLYPQVSAVLNQVAKEKDVLLAQLEIPLDTVFKALVLAKKKGLTTILNPAPAKKLPDNIYEYIDIIIPNEIEAEMITRINSNSPNFNQLVVEYFINKGVKEVIITKGCKGSIYGDSNGFITVKPFDVEVVDTTGAGDAFVGAITSCVAKGYSVKESLDFASASSALAVMKLGAQNSMPTLKEVEDFLNRKLG